MRSLARATGRKLEEPEALRLIDAQHRGYRHTFLVYGMTNATFLENLSKISQDAVHAVTHKARELA